MPRSGIDDLGRIFRWIDRYCAQNPSKLVVDAAIQFFSFGLGCTKIPLASGFKIPFRHLLLQRSDDRAAGTAIKEFLKWQRRQSSRPRNARSW